MHQKLTITDIPAVNYCHVMGDDSKMADIKNPYHFV